MWVHCRDGLYGHHSFMGSWNVKHLLLLLCMYILGGFNIALYAEFHNMFIPILGGMIVGTVAHITKPRKS
jgi:hypothetical protein